MANESTDRKTNRLEAFSDAVLAIAITLPLVELKPPEVKDGADLAAAYAELWPSYTAYALSFAVIGLHWIHSHFDGKILRQTDHGYNLLTLVFLVAVSVTPYPALPFIEHATEATNGRAAALVYAAVLAAPTVVWFVRWVYAVRNGLFDPHLDRSYLARQTWRYAVFAALACAGVALVWSGFWWIGMTLSTLVVVANALPPYTPAYRRGEEPEHDLEEADEREV